MESYPSAHSYGIMYDIMNVLRTNVEDVMNKVIVPTDLEYYDPVKNWKSIKRHLENKELNVILVNNFHVYTWALCRKHFQHGQYPSDFENHPWKRNHKGPRPAYWRYVKYEACHWLVNFALKLAMLVEPERQWRIITSRDHSTVWDGCRTLFDFNFLALGESPQRAFFLASKRGKEHVPGEFINVPTPFHPTARIVIGDAPKGGFVVVMSQNHDGHFEFLYGRHFKTHKNALAKARRLACDGSIKITDRTQPIIDEQRSMERTDEQIDERALAA